LQLVNIVADSRYRLYDDFKGVGGRSLSDYLGAVRQAILGGLENGGSDPFRVATTAAHWFLKKYFIVWLWCASWLRFGPFFFSFLLFGDFHLIIKIQQMVVKAIRLLRFSVFDIAERRLYMYFEEVRCLV
jgi:hypothetical protein